MSITDETDSSAGVEADEAEFEDLKPVLARPPILAYVRELWGRREFISTMPLNQMRATNMDTVLGNFWFLVNPALQTLVYFVIFGLLLEANRGIDNYLSYLLIGVLTFTFITSSIMAAARCIQANLTLIRSLYFPRAVIPLSTVLVGLYTFLPSLIMMVVVVLVVGPAPDLRILALPLILLVGVAMVAGCVFVIARVGKHFPDLHSLLPHLIRLGFYCSGVLFAPTSFTSNQTVLALFKANPFFDLLQMLRWSLMGRPVDAEVWFIGVGWAVVLLVGGFVFFWRDELSYGNS